ncbi:hypothetical protein [Coprobacter tertius]|uniref:Uncharacterized protein n=1 Tax=Coprobacter tertius TaxID=2944915 RepID=A0ABT1MJ74_9BACT|nr:hypothetical protein [Coprobacter tertius]MCP9612652.1 hypothetical protein [Coprobacter tertius]
MPIFVMFVTTMYRSFTGIIAIILFAVIFVGNRENDKQDFDVLNSVSSSYAVLSSSVNNTLCDRNSTTTVYHDNREFGAEIGDLVLFQLSQLVGGGFYTVVKSVSPILILSSQNKPLVEKNSRKWYLHYSFVKSSLLYFLYTLETIII